MEDSLKSLIEGNSEANRARHAMEWKKQGKKVIGVMSSYVTEEVISAAGMLPWRITGTWQEDIGHARMYRSDSSCGYCNHVLESFLRGEFDFLDGVVVADQDQDVLRVYDVLVHYKMNPFCHVMHVPCVDSELNCRHLADEIGKLKSSVEDFGGVKITDESLRSSIDTHNKMRSLLDSVYQMRKREIPPLSGAEVLGITTTAAVMPREQFNHELETLLPYLENREANLKHFHPRLLISSEMLDNPAYIDLVEEGCLVAMDDMDTGSRYFSQEVDTSLEDPIYALARRYLTSPASPRMSSWDRQAEQLIEWVKEFNVDGILGLPLTWCYLQKYRVPFLIEVLHDAGIPNMWFDREYHLANTGQLRTRIEAFLETLS